MKQMPILDFLEFSLNWSVADCIQSPPDAYRKNTRYIYQLNPACTPFVQLLDNWCFKVFRYVVYYCNGEYFWRRLKSNYRHNYEMVS